jgi:hypothetical protein
MQAAVAEPMRDEVVLHVFVEGLEIVAVEHILKIGANRCVTLIDGHHQGLPLRASDKEWRDFALIVMRINGAVEAFEDWNAAVAASVMRYSPHTSEGR